MSPLFVPGLRVLYNTTETGLIHPPVRSNHALLPHQKGQGYVID